MNDYSHQTVITLQPGWSHFFLVYIDDLKPLGTTNAIVKFADDTTLLVPEACDITVEQEIQHIQDWASLNKLSLNLNKTKELVSNGQMSLLKLCPVLTSVLSVFNVLNCLEFISILNCRLYIMLTS